MVFATLLNRALNISRPGGSLFNISVRGAAKGNRACRQDGQQKGQEYGIKIRSGMFAKAGSMLVKQRTPRFHPGLNVYVAAEKMSLMAAVNGKVLITQEKTNINMANKKIAEFYGKRDRKPLVKKYFHVIPPPQKNEFALVAQI